LEKQPQLQPAYASVPLTQPIGDAVSSWRGRRARQQLAHTDAEAPGNELAPSGATAAALIRGHSC